MSPSALKKWRGAMGYTQEAAADALGYSYAHYRHMETGRVEIKRFVALACNALIHDLKPYK